MSNGLVGWWPLHESSGQANDLSGEGDDGTVSGAIQGITGRSGLTAYSFDGTDDTISLPSFSTFNSYTISIWARIQSNTSNGPFFRLNDNNGILIRADGIGGVEYYHRDSTNGFRNIVKSSVPNYEWHHYVIRWDGSLVQAFYDTNSVGSFSSSDSSGSANGDWIGGDDSNTNYYNGELANMRVYDHALSIKEIQALYDQGINTYTEPSLSDGTDSNAITRLKLDDDSDTTAVIDSWGSNNGSITGATYATTDTIDGNALSFDGTDDSVNLGDPATLNFGSGDFTIGCWVKTPGSGTYGDIVVKEDRTNYYGWIIRMQGDTASNPGVKGSFSDSNDNSITLLFRTTIDYNEWIHITLVRDGADGYLYINGKIVATGSNSNMGSTDTTADFKLGESNDDSNLYQGEIDDVRVYNRALSPSEVHELYQWGTRGRDLRKELVRA